MLKNERLTEDPRFMLWALCVSVFQFQDLLAQAEVEVLESLVSISVLSD